ncbi:DNA polymerase III subunit gamma and tau [Nesterenkonia ebinurensis]|uniref:DNA polymerase III subunit gamma and tau n=1 Tax=Nesterenkonia ebinurensis TaxID=2608252 RepID=UPI00123D3068|nr:DNA polymerase III subunit gamma and tau [Nesterenkonia ebinurensis]
MTTALYRRYRPDTFADVIGQEHVTGPLVTALGKDAVSHAYLFSGPRGCGKTTSARILARCLNCEQGPTGAPCGECESCRNLATGGPGSLDVIEIDAASHGGVDDARDLRERATFAPVRDRYKIFIIDEAHMVTAAGFNALLKIVEEPPEHIKFIFATTEPDKVIGTIRSRTHHYPFRLVPPEPLLEYLERLCSAENVQVAPGVLQLVLRAGGGSVRDTLSVLDQLIAGAGESGLDYDRAVALLGFTHAALLDQVVDAVAALDGAKAFSVVDQVVQSGQDPRRFVEDLLERLRDLIIVKSVPDSPQVILRGVPEDQIRVMQTHVGNIGSAELSRAADITATALTEMVGATSPRLHLELLMARLLLPHAESSQASIAARLERLERRMDFTSGAGTTPPGEAPVSGHPEPTTTPVTPSAPPQPDPATASEVQERSAPATESPAGRWATPGVDSAEAVQEAPPPTEAAPSQPEKPTAGAPAQPQQAAVQAAGGSSTQRMQQAWPDVVEAMKSRSRMLWMLMTNNAQVSGFDGQTLALRFNNEGAHSTFANRGGEQALTESVQEVVGIQVRLDLDPGSGGGRSAPPPGGGAPPKAEGRSQDEAPAPSLQAPQAVASPERPAPPASPEPEAGAAPESGPAPKSASGHGSSPADDPAAEHDRVPQPPDDGWVPPTEEPPDLPPAEPGYAPRSRPGAEQPPSPHVRWAQIPASEAESGANYGQQRPPNEEPAAQQPAESAEHASPAERRVPEKPVVPAFARRSARGSHSFVPATHTGEPAAEPEPAASSPAAAGPGAELRSRLASRKKSAAPSWDEPSGAAEAFDSSPPPDWAEAPTPAAEDEDVPSEDDADLEYSGVFGRKAIERILDGVLIEERRLDDPTP